MSDFLPTLLPCVSGAYHAGDPEKRDLMLTTLAKLALMSAFGYVVLIINELPRSHSLISVPSLFTSRFAPLRSPWITLLRCKYSRALRT